VGTVHPDQDILIYDEVKNDQSYNVSVESTLSKAFVQLKIQSTFKPKTSEIWLRNASEVSSKFKCVQPMETGVNY
jgi:protease II